MHPRLSVLVQIDLDGRAVTLVVTGALTTTNQTALPTLVARARTIFPGAAITVDLTESRLLDPHAVDLLERSLGHPALGNPHLVAPQTRPRRPLSPSRLPAPLSTARPRFAEAAQAPVRLVHDHEPGLPASA